MLVHGITDVDRLAGHAQCLRQDAAHQVLGDQAVLARLRRGGDDDRYTGLIAVDGHVIAISLKTLRERHRSFRIIHGFSPTGVATPDHSPKMRTTIEIPAFFAPATMTGICRGSDSTRWKCSSLTGSASLLAPNRNTWPLPARRISPAVRPECSISQFCTSALEYPEPANCCACSGHSTRATGVCGKICGPSRPIVSAKSRSTSSVTPVARLSMNSQVRVSVADTALTPPGWPAFAASGSHGDSSSFSAMQIDHRPGTPWVACPSTCCRMPNAFLTIRPIARGMVALGRKPSPKAPPAVLNSSSCLIGPLTTISGAGPLVDWKPPPRAARSRMSASNAASTTGKYSGSQPAIAALTAAR